MSRQTIKHKDSNTSLGESVSSTSSAKSTITVGESSKNEAVLRRFHNPLSDCKQTKNNVNPYHKNPMAKKGFLLQNTKKFCELELDNGEHLSALAFGPAGAKVSMEFESFASDFNESATWYNSIGA